MRPTSCWLLIVSSAMALVLAACSGSEQTTTSTPTAMPAPILTPTATPTPSPLSTPTPKALPTPTTASLTPIPTSLAPETSRPLGTMHSVANEECTRPFGNRCIRTIVTCPGIADATVRLRVSGTGTKGTILLTLGGRGTGWYRVEEESVEGSDNINGMMDTLLVDGYKLVEVRWVGPGIWEGPGGSISLACRSATVFDWVYENIHQGGFFAAQGNSGGGAQIAFSLAYYGLDEVLDLANLSGGPPPCPISTGRRLNFLEQLKCLVEAELWNGTREPMLFGNPRLHYPNTIVRFFLGEHEPSTEIIETANAYYDAITSKKSIQIVPNTSHGVHRTEEGRAALITSINPQLMPRRALTATATPTATNSPIPTLRSSPTPTSVPNAIPTPTATPTLTGQRSPTVIPITTPTSTTADPPAESANGPSGRTRNPLPKCADQTYTVPPVDLNEVYDITPLGNLGPPGHTLPTEHMYFHISSGGASEKKIPLRAPGDIFIMEVSGGEDVDQGEFSMFFALCKEVMGYYIHIKTLADAVKELIRDIGCEVWTFNPSNICARRLVHQVAAGTVLGKVGDLQGNFDFGVYDLRTNLEYANQHQYGGRSLHIVCPLDFYDNETRSELYAKIVRTAEPKCGTVMQDVPGTLQGNWFLADAANPSGDEQLAFVHDNADPSTAVISVGGTFMNHSKWQFAPQSADLTNRDFTDVTPDGNIYCYKSDQPGIIIVQLKSTTELVIEHLQGSCTDAVQFESATTYRR